MLPVRSESGTYGRCAARRPIRLRTINGGEAHDPHSVGQQVEHAKLRPEQPGAGAHGRVRATEHLGGDPRQLEKLNWVMVTVAHTVTC